MRRACGALDHGLLFVHADDEVADDQIGHLQPPIDFLHQFAGAVDDFQHVGAFLVPADLVGKPAAAPVVGLLDRGRRCAARWLRPGCADRRPDRRSPLATRRRRARTFWFMRLLLDVDSIPACAGHLTACRAAQRASREARSQSLSGSVASGLYMFITLPMSSTANISAASAARVMNVSSSARSPALELREHVIGEIAPAVSAPDPQPQPGETPSCRAARSPTSGRCARPPIRGPAPAACRTAAPLRRRRPADPTARCRSSASAPPPPRRCGS